MRKQTVFNTCLLVIALGILSCESGMDNGPVRPDIVVPSTSSTFVYDYEQRIIPVKPEDDDTTYRFELTAKVDKHQAPSSGVSDIISIRLYDSEGFEMPHLWYKLAFDEEGNVKYNEPYFSNAWTKMAFATKESLTGPDTSIGDLSNYHLEVHQKTTYLGSEQLMVDGEMLECEKIEWTRNLKEADVYTTILGTQSERHIFWFSKKIGFFVARETEYTSSRLHKPQWKYTTKERLKRYTLQF